MGSRIKLILIEDDRTVEVNTSPSVCSYVVREMYYFLLATSYHKTSIIEAFREIANEFESHKKPE